MNQKYCSSMEKILNEKNINYVIFDYVDAVYLQYILPKCKYQLLYCSHNHDPNPRAIIEGLWAGLPSLVSDLVTVPTKIKELNMGVICRNNDPNDLNLKMVELLNINHGDEIIQKCESDLCINTVGSINTVGNNIISDFNNLYCSIKKISA
jgi:glycosyltransferase involved in cell wall biosynthesis